MSAPSANFQVTCMGDGVQRPRSHMQTLKLKDCRQQGPTAHHTSITMACSHEQLPVPTLLIPSLREQ
jgi:hypothetical protein